MVELRDAGRELVTAYRYDGFAYQPFCHPVNLPGEIPLTLSNPGDHPWHNGMYFSWKYLNGFNVWDFEASGPAPGRVEHRAIELDSALPALTHEIAWCDARGNELLRDRRRLEVVASPASGLIHAFDWHFHFECVAGEVVCERDANYGGYAGLGIRFARGGANTLLKADGETDWKENWDDPSRFRSPWVAYAFSLDGLPSRTWNANWAGMALFDHPSNPRFPTPWLTFNGLGMQKILAAFIRHEPFVFRKGDTLDLRYRAVSFNGRPDLAVLENAWKEWAAVSL